MSVYIQMRKNKNLTYNNIKILKEFSEIYSETAKAFLDKINYFIEDIKEV